MPTWKGLREGRWVIMKKDTVENGVTYPAGTYGLVEAVNFFSVEVTICGSKSNATKFFAKFGEAPFHVA